MGCPTSETLGLLADDALASDRRAALVEHLEGCDACRAIAIELVRRTASTAAATVDGPRAAAPAPVDAGTTIGRYVVDRPLGAGGMGIVYLAHDPELDRPIALKLLRVASASGGDRLRREARALAQLAHPNVVAVHDVGEHDGRIFVAMERVDGCDLRAWLRERPRTWRETVENMIAAARGLEAAHAAGLLHRDIKPDNILVGKDGRARVSDFGLATSIGDGADAEHLAGTPAYMSPERIAGGDDDVSSDLWSFVVTLHEALYRQRPFAGVELAELFAAIAAVEVAPPPAKARVPAWLRRVIARGLDRDPAARWPSVAALRAALERGLHRRRTALLAVGASGAIAAAAIAWSVTRAPAGGPSCDAAGEIPDPIWGPTRRAAVERAFAASAAPQGPRALAEVDAWVADWRAAAQAACQAGRSGGQSAALTDRRLACLDARLQGVDALLDRWEAGAPGALERAVGAIRQVGSIDACSAAAQGSGPPPPTDPAVAAKVDAARIEILRAWALYASGDPAAAVARLEQLTAEAEALAYPALVAELHLATSSFARFALDHVKAERLLRAAIAAAEASQHDRAKAEACAYLVGILGQTDRAAEAHHWADYAAAALDRIGGDDGLAAVLAENLGVVLGTERRHAEATAQFRRAVELRVRHDGAGSFAHGVALEYLAGSLANEGEIEEAAAVRAEALAIWTTVFGDHAGLNAILLDTRRDTALEAGDVETALRADTERLRAAQILIPDQPLFLAGIESNLAYDHMLGGDWVGSMEHHRRAIALRESAGDRGLALADSLSEVGQASLELGRPAEALPVYRQAIELAAAATGLDAEELLATSRAGLGRALLATGDPTAAREPLELALAWREAHVGELVPPAMLGRSRLSLAEALVAVDPARARTLATAARADLTRALDDMKAKPGAIWAHFRTRIAAELERLDGVVARLE